MLKFVAAVLPLSLLLAAQPALAKDHTDPLQGTANGLAMTPPMGWNSWNKIGVDVNEKAIRDAADAMVSSGMRDAGYRYIMIDDFWQGERDAARQYPARSQALSVRHQEAGRLCSLQGIVVRYLFGCRDQDLRRTARQPRLRISGRQAICGLGRRLFEIRLVQYRHAGCRILLPRHEPGPSGDRTAHRVQPLRMGKFQPRGYGRRISAIFGAPRATSTTIGKESTPTATVSG